MILTLEVAVMIVGAFVYALSVNPKLVELGRIAYGFALLALLLHFGGVVNVLPVK